MPRKKTPDNTVIIKKYANRRLYNTQTSCYITLDDLRELIQAGEEVKVVDAKSSEDLTRSVLVQLIVEQENRGENLLPVDFLKSIIKTYNTNVQGMVPQYLEASMEHFARNQHELQQYMERSMREAQQLFQVGQVAQMTEQWEEWRRQQMDAFRRSMEMWDPFRAFREK